MKRFIITLAVIAAAATSAMAQISVGAGYLNATSSAKSTISGDESFNHAVAFSGFYAGASAAYNLGSGLAVLPGVYYEMLQFDGYFASYVEGKTVNHYVSVPINLNFTYKITSSLSASAYVGPSFNLCLASNTTGSINIFNVSTTFNNFDEGGTLERFDLSLGAGIGLTFADLIKVSGGYNYGLLDQNKSEHVIVNNSGWHVGVAILF